LLTAIFAVKFLEETTITVENMSNRQTISVTHNSLSVLCI